MSEWTKVPGPCGGCRVTPSSTGTARSRLKPGSDVLANPVVFEVVRRRQFPIVAAGTLAAIQSGRTGDYNIVDGSVVVHPHRRRSHGDPDDPAPVAEWLPFLAAEIDAAL